MTFGVTTDFKLQNFHQRQHKIRAGISYPSYSWVLGRPLQPNSAGGLPGLPQSLNRYAASSVGQPGVAAGVASDLNLWPDIFGWAKGAALDLAAFIPIEQGYFGQARVTLQASHSKLTRQVFRQYGQDLFEGISGPIPGKLRQTSTILPLFSPTRDGIDKVAETIATRLRGNLGFSLRRINIQVEVIEGTLTARYIKLGTFRWFRNLKFGLGPAFDAGLGGYLQYLGDRDNPLLTPGQKALRIGTAGVGSVGIAYGIGVGLTYLGCTATVYCGIAAGVIGTLAWVNVQARIFEAVPFLRPADRSLQPLNIQ